MKTIMTIAVGLAIGYFLYQYFVSNNGGKLNGRIHKSATDKKIFGVCGANLFSAEDIFKSNFCCSSIYLS